MVGSEDKTPTVNERVDRIVAEDNAAKWRYGRAVLFRVIAAAIIGGLGYGAFRLTVDVISWLGGLK